MTVRAWDTISIYFLIAQAQNKTSQAQAFDGFDPNLSCHTAFVGVGSHWEVATGNPDIALLKSSLENSVKVLWLLPVSLRAGSLVTTVHSQNATALASKSSLGDHQKLFEVTLRESFRKTETGKSVSYGQNPLGPNLASILSSYWSSPKLGYIGQEDQIASFRIRTLFFDIKGTLAKWHHGWCS